MIVIDTDIISELSRPDRSPVVAAWGARQAWGELRTTAINVAEVRYGIALMPDGARREQVRREVEVLFAQFHELVLPLGNEAAARYAWIRSSKRAAGQPMAAFDALIAAICWEHGAALATRNTKDFTDCDIELVDPFQATRRSSRG